MMNKLSNSIKKEILVTASSRDEIIQSVLTIYRFKSLTPIYRSLDMINSIDELLKGSESKRN